MSSFSEDISGELFNSSVNESILAGISDVNIIKQFSFLQCRTPLTSLTVTTINQIMSVLSKFSPRTKSSDYTDVKVPLSGRRLSPQLVGREEENER